MKFNLKSELPTIIVVLLPFLYLAYLWSTLPETVPIHWNLQGEVDGYGSKTTLLLIPFALPFLTYILFLLIPYASAGKELRKMGSKFHLMKMGMTFIMSLLAIYIIYLTQQQNPVPDFLSIFIGLIFVIAGNFFPALKPNKYIGIRIPPTLKSERNWKATHRFASKIWIVGGLLAIIYSLIADAQSSTIFLLSIGAILVIVPIVYSYRLASAEKPAIR